MAARTWLAVILSLGVWFVYEQWFAPKRPLPTGTTAVESTTAPGAAASSPSTIQSANGPLGPVYTTREDYWVKGEHLELAFSDVGGQISTAKLVKYRDSSSGSKTSQPVTLVSPDNTPYALSTVFSDSALAGLNDAVYQRKSQGNNIVFETKLPSGVSFRKQYEVDAANYQVKATYTVSFSDVASQAKGYLSLPLGGKNLKYDHNEPLHSWEVVLFQNDAVQRKHISDLKETPEVLQGNTSWLAFGNRYFSTVVRNDVKLNPDALLQTTPQFAGGQLRYPIALKDGEKDLTIKVTYFVTPKDYELLSKTTGLRRLIDYGMFSFLAYPLLDLLRFFYQHVIQNYGVAIILLTLLVRLLFYPLSLQSFKSMREMQKLQPRLAELKEKYGEDRERFQREQMALFKTHKVNPFGGCLPIMVQIPVFIALYAVLGNSIELFQAPFFGWIHDLSAKDPWYVFPVLMGISMVIQQKITPAVGMDPTQQKIMMVMPVVFSFMMLSLPSGLTVYMFVSTLLGILQQYIITKTTGQKLPAAKVAPPERA